VVSSVSATSRPPATGRTKTRMRTGDPLAYATVLPSGEIAGSTSITGSQVTFVVEPKVIGRAAGPDRCAPRR